MSDNTYFDQQEPPEEPDDLFGDDRGPGDDGDLLAGPDRQVGAPRQSPARHLTDTDDILCDRAHHVLIRNLAAYSGQPGGDMLDMFNDVLVSDLVKDLVAEGTWKTWVRAKEILDSVYADFPADLVEYADIPELDNASSVIRYFFTQVCDVIDSGERLPRNPFASWSALKNRIRRFHCRTDAVTLIRSLDNGATDVDLLTMIDSLTLPASATKVAEATFTATAKEWEESYALARATTPDMRYSFGMPSLDKNMTAQNGDGTFSEPVGCLAPGEFAVIAAATGNGKSTLARPMASSLAQDLRNWNRPNDKVLVLITEENPEIVLKAGKMGAGQSMHHVSEQVVIANVGSSRARIAQAVYALIAAAEEKSKETGLPLRDCGLPAVIIWDYIGGTVENGEAGDTVAMERNANLALRGFCNWDQHGMESFSGESFKEFSGTAWPKGMEFFRPSVVAFAQFKKLADPTWYDPANKACNIADFVLDNPDGSPAWEVQPGDFRVPKQEEVRGSGVLINHATTLMILHRSRPQKNPKVIINGQVHLSDTRARLLLVKTRNGANSPVISVAFDSQPNGLRGQFYDPLEEAWIHSGKVTPADGYNELGDPILPVRPANNVTLVTY